VTVRPPDSSLESLEQRYDSLLRLLPFLLLTVPLLPYFLSQRPTAGAFAITVGVAVAAGAWITWMVILHPGWAERPWLMGVFFVGLIAFIAVLTVRSPWFAFFTWLGFLYAFRFLTGAWRWAACAVVAIFFGMSQSGGFHRPTVSTVAIWVLLASVDVVLTGVFVLLGVKTEEQNQARKGMIAELAQANQRLEEMMAENTGLQAKLLTQAREAGAGDERQRMAREIHDTLAQGREPAREPLSQRELDILGLISRGCSNREAAARLFISEATVKTHVLHIYAKLGVNDRAAAVAAGFERGLLPRPLKPSAPVPAHGGDLVVRADRGLPGEDLTDLTRDVIRVPVKHRL
jgi:DNA-binding CsgD family transcriptional regulator